MHDRHFQLIGLLGFVVAGVVFVASGIRAGDELTIAGSVVWTVACLVWMVPLLRTDDP